MMLALLVLAIAATFAAVVWAVLATIGLKTTAKEAARWYEAYQVTENHRLAAIDRHGKNLRTVHDHMLKKGHAAGYKEGVEAQRTKMLAEVGTPHLVSKMLMRGTLTPGEHERFRHEAIETLLKEGFAIRSEFTWTTDMTPAGAPYRSGAIALEGVVLTTPLAPAPDRTKMSNYLFEYQHTTELKPS